MRTAHGTRLSFSETVNRNAELCGRPVCAGRALYGNSAFGKRIRFCMTERRLPVPVREAGSSLRTRGDFNRTESVVKQPGGEEIGLKPRTKIKEVSNQRVSAEKIFFQKDFFRRSGPCGFVENLFYFRFNKTCLLPKLPLFIVLTPKREKKSFVLHTNGRAGKRGGLPARAGGETRAAVTESRRRRRQSRRLRSGRRAARSGRAESYSARSCPAGNNRGHTHIRSGDRFPSGRAGRGW